MVSTSSSNSSDNNALLVKLCVKVLSNVAPEGMTTKELAAELDKEVAPGFNGISSSILSSKLNAVFRRSHNDSPTPSNEQLSELPLTRTQSTEVPRRLVYRYSPPTNLQPKLEKNIRSNTRTETDEPKEEANDDEQEVIPSTPDGALSNSSDDPSEPLTPKEEGEDKSASWPAAKRRRLSAGTSKPGADAKSGDSTTATSTTAPVTEKRNQSKDAVCPNTPPSAVESAPSRARADAKPRLQKPQQPKFNLYYDAVGFDLMTSALSPSATDVDSREESASGLDLDTWTEIASPESLGLNDIDKLVC